MILPSPVVSSLELALNNALRLDNHSFRRVVCLVGKVIKIDLQVIDLQFYLAPVPDGIQVLADYDKEPDATIEGSPLALLRTALIKDQQTLRAGDVKIIGDTDLGQKFQAILNNLEIDWEESLSQLFGDVAGHQMGDLIRGFSAFAQNAFDSLSQSTTEYFKEESKDLLSTTEVERFADGVDEIRAATERLQLRIERLQKKSLEPLS